MKLSKTLFSKLLFVFMGIAIAIILNFAYSYYYRLSDNVDITLYEDTLRDLAEKCLTSGDVPVSSLLIYNDSIIGKGYNDVSKNNNPSGHAEINAVKNCFERIGYKNFKKLNRNKLTLISTYEPCTMCRGLIEEYNIKKVIFSFPKNYKDKLIIFKKNYTYYQKLKQSTNKRLQYNLFKQYKSFDSINYPF
nr:nucleoside deaminase [Gaetbulibacter sp. 4G1]